MDGTASPSPEASGMAVLQQQFREMQAQLENAYAQLQEKDQEMQRLESAVECAHAEAAEALEIADAQNT